jgi:hypothetical protein
MRTLTRGVAALTLAVVMFSPAVFIGCGGSGTPAPTTKTISTDSTINKGLLTSFTGPNSVTISGTWTNTTYGSTGDVTANVVFDTTTNVVTVIFDIDGNVYGGTDPAPETFTLNMTDFIRDGTATLTFTSAVYGDVSGTLTFYTDNTGIFSGTATNAPNAAVTNASFSGTFEISGAAVSFAIVSARFDFNGVGITCTDSLTSTIN